LNAPASPLARIDPPLLTKTDPPWRRGASLLVGAGDATRHGGGEHVDGEVGVAGQVVAAVSEVRVNSGSGGTLVGWSGRAVRGGGAGFVGTIFEQIGVP